MKLLPALALLCLVAASGCKTPQFALGTTEADFKSKSHPQLVSMNKDMTIYMLSIHKMSEYENIFYYFVDGKLVQVDHGVSKPDVLIQNQ